MGAAVGLLDARCPPAAQHCAPVAARPRRDTRHLTPNPQHPHPASPFWECTAQVMKANAPLSLWIFLEGWKKKKNTRNGSSAPPRCSASSNSNCPQTALGALLCTSARTASSVVLNPAPLFAFQTAPFKSTLSRHVVTTGMFVVNHLGAASRSALAVLGPSPPPPPH